MSGEGRPKGRVPRSPIETMHANGATIAATVVAVVVHCCRVASWCCGRAIKRSRVRVSAGHYGVKTLDKFLTPMVSP